jgi:hypothetical protein
MVTDENARILFTQPQKRNRATEMRVQHNNSGFKITCLILSVVPAYKTIRCNKVWDHNLVNFLIHCTTSMQNVKHKYSLLSFERTQQYVTPEVSQFSAIKLFWWGYYIYSSCSLSLNESSSSATGVSSLLPNCVPTVAQKDFQHLLLIWYIGEKKAITSLYSCFVTCNSVSNINISCTYYISVLWRFVLYPGRLEALIWLGSH